MLFKSCRDSLISHFKVDLGRTTTTSRMSHRCPICASTFTRSFNLRRHVERVHKRREDDSEGNSVASEGSVEQLGDSEQSGMGSYYEHSESDTNESAASESDTVTDRDDADSTDNDTEGTNSEEEYVEDDTVTDSDGEEEDVGRGNVSGTIETMAALTEMNKAMGNILKRALQNM